MHSKRTRRGRSAPPASDDSDTDLLSDTLFGSPEPSSQSRGRADRKLRPLCREVQRTLDFALAAARDPVLRDLSVVAVEPAPDASRLMVIICLSPQATQVDDVHDALSRARGSLRAELARVLQRKRTPELVFSIHVPGSDDEPGESR